ncbi:Hypothetical predicted protein [Podarcis lilfordi]|uniref:Uncharacterized protein n=1 Tax=Podarcis lilfordi TaxID=74358 RepID=A0AA35KA73_9SAUR|nr:Hypothetical predicted protein [Podarcis lilfordi]
MLTANPLAALVTRTVKKDNCSVAVTSGPTSLWASSFATNIEPADRTSLNRRRLLLMDAMAESPHVYLLNSPAELPSSTSCTDLAARQNLYLPIWTVLIFSFCQEEDSVFTKARKRIPAKNGILLDVYVFPACSLLLRYQT